MVVVLLLVDRLSSTSSAFSESYLHFLIVAMMTSSGIVSPTTS